MTATLSRCSFDQFKATRERTAKVMFQFGGSFCQALAMAVQQADPANLRRIYDAFPELLSEYEPGGKFHAA